MTTDVKLPEPVACRWRGSGRVHYLRWVYANAGSPSTPPSGAEPLYTADQVRAHAAKLLAENEALRGEVDQWCRQARYETDVAADAIARAERLAEALREATGVLWDSGYPNTASRLRAALDQEGGNG